MNKAFSTLSFYLFLVLVFFTWVFDITYSSAIEYEDKLNKVESSLDYSYFKPKLNVSYSYYDSNGNLSSYFFSKTTCVFFIDNNFYKAHYEQNGAELKFSFADNIFPSKMIAYFSEDSFFVYNFDEDKFIEFKIE